MKTINDPRHQYTTILLILKSDNTFNNQKQETFKQLLVNLEREILKEHPDLKNTLIGVKIYPDKTDLKFHLKQSRSQKTLHAHTIKHQVFYETRDRPVTPKPRSLLGGTKSLFGW